ncbi:hypothetical protein PAPYR_3082 [Paratrimastix pyriformis]|uniref:ATP-dependent RNA helicase PRP5/DDX46/KHDC4 KH domain-containing protein n=1 Tax=Paratrimastix pyriformis TaxID=342808 RepID=A0ABQ8UNT6_9EUKA|nr:hypothetical protein PAPYR_3082 [Paratrimastix pyriformis]
MSMQPPPSEREVEINDCPNRDRLTRKGTHEEIRRKTGASIITRGVYKAPGTSTPGRALHLFIAGPSPQAVDEAERLIRGIIDEGKRSATALGLQHPDLISAPAGMVVAVPIPIDSQFDVVARLLGPDNGYFDHIARECEGAVELLLRGAEIPSGYSPKYIQSLLSCFCRRCGGSPRLDFAPSAHQSQTPHLTALRLDPGAPNLLDVHLCTPSPDTLRQAAGLVHNLVQTVWTDYRQWCLAQGMVAPPPDALHLPELPQAPTATGAPPPGPSNPPAAVTTPIEAGSVDLAITYRTDGPRVSPEYGARFAAPFPPPPFGGAMSMPMSMPMPIPGPFLPPPTHPFAPLAAFPSGTPPTFLLGGPSGPPSWPALPTQPALAAAAPSPPGPGLAPELPPVPTAYGMAHAALPRPSDPHPAMAQGFAPAGPPAGASALPPPFAFPPPLAPFPGPRPPQARPEAAGPQLPPPMFEERRTKKKDKGVVRTCAPGCAVAGMVADAFASLFALRRPSVGPPQKANMAATGAGTSLENQSPSPVLHQKRPASQISGPGSGLGHGANGDALSPRAAASGMPSDLLTRASGSADAQEGSASPGGSLYAVPQPRLPRAGKAAAPRPQEGRAQAAPAPGSGPGSSAPRGPSLLVPFERPPSRAASHPVSLIPAQ